MTPSSAPTCASSASARTTRSRLSRPMQPHAQSRDRRSGRSPARSPSSSTAPMPPRAAVAASEALFGAGDLRALDAATLEAAFADLPRARVGGPNGLPSVLDLLVESGLSESRGQARRVLGRGRRLRQQRAGCRSGGGPGSVGPARRALAAPPTREAPPGRCRGDRRMTLAFMVGALASGFAARAWRPC